MSAARRGATCEQAAPAQSRRSYHAPGVSLQNLAALHISSHLLRGFGAVGISERLFCEGRVRLESPNEFMLSFDAARFRRQQLPACSASTADFFHFLSAAASLSGSDVIVACVLRRAAFVRCCLLRGSEVRLASNQLDFRSSSHIPQLLMTFQTKTETELQHVFHLLFSSLIQVCGMGPSSQFVLSTQSRCVKRYHAVF